MSATNTCTDMAGFSVVIPVLNEEKTIRRALRETAEVFQGLLAPYEIIVVDDGSTDGTAAMVHEEASRYSGVSLLRHPRNRGKGAALQSGIAAARGDWIVFLDADLATHPSDIQNAIPLLPQADLLFGSRSHPASVINVKQPLFRVLAGRFFNLVGIRWYLGLPYKDTQCGFKLLHSTLKPLCASLRTEGWVFDAELIARAQQAGHRIQEFPVTWRHGRDTRVKLTDIWKILNDLKMVKGFKTKE